MRAQKTTAVMDTGGSEVLSRPLLSVTKPAESRSLFRVGAESVGPVPLNSHTSLGATPAPSPKQPPRKLTSCSKHHIIDGHARTRETIIRVQRGMPRGIQQCTDSYEIPCCL